MKSKHFLCFLLALCLSLAVVSTGVAAEPSEISYVQLILSEGSLAPGEAVFPEDGKAVANDLVACLSPRFGNDYAAKDAYWFTDKGGKVETFKTGSIYFLSVTLTANDGNIFADEMYGGDVRNSDQSINCDAIDTRKISETEVECIFYCILHPLNEDSAIEVTFDKNGHGKDGDVPAALEIMPDSAVAETLNFNIDNYTMADDGDYVFCGWSTRKNIVPASVTSRDNVLRKRLYRDTTLYAVWGKKIDKIELTYDGFTAPAVGGEVQAIDQQKVLEANNKTTVRVIEWESHIREWSAESPFAADSRYYLFTEIVPAEGSDYVLSEDIAAENITFNGKQALGVVVDKEFTDRLYTAFCYDIGEVKTHTVTFEDGGHGKLPFAKVQAHHGTSLEDAAYENGFDPVALLAGMTRREFFDPIPADDSWIFTGWKYRDPNTNELVEYKKYDSSGKPTPITEDITLIAQWEQVPVIEEIDVTVTLPQLNDPRSPGPVITATCKNNQQQAVPLSTWSSVQKTDNPNFTTYTEGDYFLDLSISVDDPNAKEVFKGYTQGNMIDPSKLVKINFHGVEGSNAFVVNIYEQNIYLEKIPFSIFDPAKKSLTGLTVTTPPTKTQYAAGEAFAKAGMVVTAAYSDNTTAPVTGYQLFPGENVKLKPSNTSILVSYKEGPFTRTATVPITVTDVVSDPVKEVEELIKKISDPVTKDDEAAVKAARAAYDKLSKEDKAKVDPALVKKLENAEKVLSMLLCKRDNTCPLAKFKDLKPGAWYHDGVHYCLENGIMEGMSATTFQPNGDVTRAQLVTILWNMEGKPATTAKNPFNDVKNSNWFYTQVVWASEKGIVNGMTATTFVPNGKITREQFATMMYRYAEYKKYDVTKRADLSGYSDANKIGSWALDAMKWANAEGLITGTTGPNNSTILDPRGKATRAQAATIIQRFCVNIAK